MDEPVKVPGLQTPPQGVNPLQPPPVEPVKPSGSEPPPPTPPPAIDVNTMVYPNTPDIPEALRGKPLKEGIQRGVQASLENERLKSEMKAQGDNLKSLEGKIKSLMGEGGELSEEDQKRKDEEKFVNDPVGFMRADHAKRIEPLVSQYLKNQEDFQESMMGSRYPRYAQSEELRGKVRELMDKVDPRIRGQKETWDMAIKLARYEELEKLEAEVMASKGYHVESGGGAPPPPPPKVELTDEEKAAAEDWGMSAEEFKQWSNPLEGAEG